MADQSSEFSVDLDTDGTVGPAEKAASALEALKAKMAGAENGIRGLQRAQNNLKRGGLEGSDQFKALGTKIAAHKKELAEATQSYVQLGGTFDKNKAKSSGFGKELGQLQAKMRALDRGGGDGPGKQFSFLESIAKKLPAPLGAVLTKLIQIQGASGAAKTLLLKVAYVALAASVIAAAVALTRYGVASSDARRSESLQLEGLTKVRRWYAGNTRLAADSAGFLQEQIDRVSASSALGRDQIKGYTEQLYRMGLRSGNLQAALEGVAITASAQGDAQAQRFASWAAGAALTGRSVRALADDVKARLGGIAARQMLSLDVQMKKFRENVSFLFSGLKLEGFLKSLNMVTELFSANTASGKALKTIFESLFQPLTGALESTGPLAKRFFQGLIISALMFTITLLQIRRGLKNAFGDSNVISSADKLKLALGAGVAVGTLFVAIMAALAIKLAIVTAPIWALGMALYGAFSIGMKLGKGLIWSFEQIQKYGWVEGGKNIVRGIANGIMSGISLVVDAMKSMAMSGWKAFTSAFDMHSPSRLMARTSINIPRGEALGIKAGIPEVKRASEQLARVTPQVMMDAPNLSFGTPSVAAPDTGKAESSQGSKGGAPGRAPASISIGEVKVLAGNEANAKNIAASIKDELMSVLQGVSAQLGGEEPATT